MASQEWWQSFTDTPFDHTPDIPAMNKVWQKISPVTFVFVENMEVPQEYWSCVETILRALSGSREVPSAVNDFRQFLDKLFEVRFQLDPQTPEDAVAFILSSTKVEDSNFLIWEFSDRLISPDLFVKALDHLLRLRTPVRAKIAQFPGTLDFIFDHYFPLLETGPLEGEPDTVIARINLFQFLCKFLIDFPDKILRFKELHRMMWSRLLKIMKNGAPTIIIAAFRTATQFYKATMDRLDPQTQASWLLKFVENNSYPSLLHQPTIRFAMVIRPKEFGFVTLCKTLIDQGIPDQCDLGMINRVIRLPVVKNPTEIFQYIFKLACTDKLLGNAARRMVQRPLLKFKELAPFKPWAVLFVKRSFQFVVFASEKQKYIRRVWLIVHFHAMLLTLEIDWLTAAINLAATTILKMGKCEKILGRRFATTSEVDPKMQEELEKTPVERLNLKTFLNHVKVTIPLIDDTSDQSASGSAQNSGRSSGRRGKPTIAEVKARFLAAKGAGKLVSTTDLWLLDGGDPADGDTTCVIDADGIDNH
jgi:hypothetical protein